MVRKCIVDVGTSFWSEGGKAGFGWLMRWVLLGTRWVSGMCDYESDDCAYLVEGF